MHFNCAGGAGSQMRKVVLIFVRHIHEISASERQRSISTLQKGMVQSFIPANKSNLKSAGVMVPLCQVNGKASILYTIRSNGLNEHRGEVR